MTPEPFVPIFPERIWHCQQPLRFGPVEVMARMTVERIVLAHDTIIEDDAARRLSRAFAWLR